MNWYKISVGKLMLFVTDSAKKPFRKNSTLWHSLQTAVQVADRFLLGDQLVLRSQKVKSIELTLNLVGDKKIKSLNRDYRQKDRPTDVLSFPVHDSLRELNLHWPLEEQLIAGDIVISRDTARRQAKEFDIAYESEIAHLFFHGLLHLCGFDHERGGKEEELMEKLESILVNDWFKIKEKKWITRKNIR